MVWKKGKSPAIRCPTEGGEKWDFERFVLILWPRSRFSKIGSGEDGPSIIFSWKIRISGKIPYKSQSFTNSLIRSQVLSIVQKLPIHFCTFYNFHFVNRIWTCNPFAQSARQNTKNRSTKYWAGKSASGRTRTYNPSVNSRMLCHWATKAHRSDMKHITTNHLNPATTYSPGPFPAKYHQRAEA